MSASRRVERRKMRGKGSWWDMASAAFHSDGTRATDTFSWYSFTTRHMRRRIRRKTGPSCEEGVKRCCAVSHYAKVGAGAHACLTQTVKDCVKLCLVLCAHPLWCPTGGEGTGQVVGANAKAVLLWCSINKVGWKSKRWRRGKEACGQGCENAGLEERLPQL